MSSSSVTTDIFFLTASGAVIRLQSLQSQRDSGERNTANCGENRFMSFIISRDVHWSNRSEFDWAILDTELLPLVYLGNFAYRASAASTSPVIQFSISGLQAELDSLLQMCLVWHSREKVRARDLACADPWAVVPFLGLYLADQGSFKAILDHPCVALWYLFSVPPHAVTAFLLMGRASRFPAKRKMMWEDGEELLPGFLEASCDVAGPPAGVPRHLCIGSVPSAQGTRAPPASRHDCIPSALTVRCKGKKKKESWEIDLFVSRQELDPEALS